MADLNTMRGKQISIQIGRLTPYYLIQEKISSNCTIGSFIIYISLGHVRQFLLDSNKDDRVDYRSEFSCIENKYTYKSVRCTFIGVILKDLSPI